MKRTEPLSQNWVTVVIRPEGCHSPKPARMSERVDKGVFIGQTQAYEVQYEGQALQVTTIIRFWIMIFGLGTSSRWSTFF
ncbi:hypothetical protein WJ0W_004418 [Paenibacillus melissococcoides]|uniref:Uncharacterized protein n=1 Tax=Paenibacillus melissococcoides TaxID=2912268 RepID=A0ABN8U7V0_9BACL|nr:MULTISPECIES: hypothetical protein [Paenibacillus]CAH8247183.1 hypothetical protein WJ0W_004418 [Paenibacillus melissococcoides]